MPEGSGMTETLRGEIVREQIPGAAPVGEHSWSRPEM